MLGWCCRAGRSTSYTLFCTKHQIHTLPDSNTVEYLLRLQTRLLYEANKASLYCKTNLFAVQGSLVCVWGVCVLWLSGLGV